jgi:hypothetical protein
MSPILLDLGFNLSFLCKNWILHVNWPCRPKVCGLNWLLTHRAKRSELVPLRVKPMFYQSTSSALSWFCLRVSSWVCPQSIALLSSNVLLGKASSSGPGLRSTWGALLRSALDTLLPTLSMMQGMENRGTDHGSNSDKHNKGDERKSNVNPGHPSKRKEHMTRA